MKTYSFNDKIIIREEIESYSRTGFVYRAYDRDSGIPLYVGMETLKEEIERLKGGN